MLPRVAFVVPGHPVSKQRARKGANGRFYTPSKTSAYERTVAQICLAAMAEAGYRRYSGTWPRDATYGIDILIVPGSLRRFDWDNVAKAVQDALNGILWDDDSQVWSASVVKTEVDRSRPRVEVKVEVLASKAGKAREGERKEPDAAQRARSNPVEDRPPHLPARRVSARRSRPV